MNPEEHIPSFHQKLFRWLCQDESYNELAGDLEEAFIENHEVFGTEKAKSIYKKEVLKMMRPSVLRKFKIIPSFTPFDMIKNYFKISFRNIWRDKEHSLISIFGLATGIVASVLIFQYVNFETSYDMMHDQSDGKIYRISRISKDLASGDIDSKASSHYMGIQSRIAIDMPEVMSATQLYPFSGILTYDVVGHNADVSFFTTSSLFEVFDFKLLEGIASDLDEPGTIFISSSQAKRIFGDENPMGKLIRYNATNAQWQLELQIKGIYEDFPENSHISNPAALLCVKQFNEFADTNFFPNMEWNELMWRFSGYHTYVKVLSETNEEDFPEKVEAFLMNYRAAYNEIQGREQSTMPHALEDIHFVQDYDDQLTPAGDLRIINLFKFIGVLIVLIAWTNYVNLASAKAVKRAKEIGIRKSLGAFKKQLITQFLLESILVNLIALVVAIGIVILVIPKFQQLTGSNAFDFFQDFLPFWTIYFTIYILGALLSGLYPAIVLTKFDPIKVLRGNFSNSSHGVWLRKSLIFLQFAIVLVMLTGIMAIRSQIKFMMDADMGMNMEQTLAIPPPPAFLRDSTYLDKAVALQGQIENNSNVITTTISSIVPGVRNGFFQTINRTDQPSGQTVMLYRSFVDHDFVTFYGLDVIAGRDFDESLVGDQSVILINREAVERYNFESPEDAIGKQLDFTGGVQPRIVGVVENFSQMGVKFAVEPLAIQLTAGGFGYINVRLETQNIVASMEYLEDQYAAFFPGAPFEAFFLDQNFNEVFEADKQFKAVLEFFAMVAIFISCLGVFGLSSFLINQKMKEVSIRKVLGAGIGEIIKVLTTEYIWLVLISTIVAVPLAYYFISEWLNTFLVRIDLSLIIFTLPVIGLLAIILITVGNKTRKAAITNPATTLKSE
jgi:putative ABC transport system permease protein